MNGSFLFEACAELDRLNLDFSFSSEESASGFLYFFFSYFVGFGTGGGFVIIPASTLDRCSGDLLL